jgi:hypothetical protein
VSKIHQSTTFSRLNVALNDTPPLRFYWPAFLLLGWWVTLILFVTFWGTPRPAYYAVMIPFGAVAFAAELWVCHNTRKTVREIRRLVRERLKRELEQIDSPSA